MINKNTRGGSALVTNLRIKVPVRNKSLVMKNMKGQDVGNCAPTWRGLLTSEDVVLLEKTRSLRETKWGKLIDFGVRVGENPARECHILGG